MELRENIFNILKSFGFKMKLYDSEGNGPLIIPDESDYIYGQKGKMTLMIVVDDESQTNYSSVRIFKNSDIEGFDFRKIYLKLREAILKYSYTVSVKNIGKSFTPYDFSSMPKETQAKRAVTEKYDVSGTKKTSYHKTNEAKIIVKHKSTVDESKHNPRSRNAKAIYVQTSSGEKRKVPTLTIGKAIANHVNYGGNLYDPEISDIINMNDIFDNIGGIDFSLSEHVSEDVVQSIKTMIADKKKQFRKNVSNWGKRKSKISECKIDKSLPKYSFAKSYFESFVNEDDAEKLSIINTFI